MRKKSLLIEVSTFTGLAAFFDHLVTKGTQTEVTNSRLQFVSAFPWFFGPQVILNYKRILWMILDNNYTVNCTLHLFIIFGTFAFSLLIGNILAFSNFAMWGEANMLFMDIFLIFRIWNSTFIVYRIYLPNMVWKDKAIKMHDIENVTIKNKKPNCTGERSRWAKCLMSLINIWKSIKSEVHLTSVLQIQSVFFIICPQDTFSCYLLYLILQYFLSKYLHKTAQKSYYNMPYQILEN